MSQKVKIILANARLVSGNLGCEALAECAMLLLDTVMREEGCDYELLLSDSGYHDKGVRTFMTGGRKIDYRVCTYPRENGFMRNVRVFARNLLRGWPDEFRQADLVLNVGQGDSFSDIYGRERFERTDLCDRLARANGVPYAFLPQTIGPFGNSDTAVRAGRSLSDAAFVMCRDSASLDCCRELAPSSSCAGFTDMAFMLPYERERLDGDCVHVGLGVSALLWHGGYDGRNGFGLKCDYRALVRAIIEYFRDMEGTVVHLVPHVVTPGNDIENDAAVCVALEREYAGANVVAAPAFMSASRAKSYIAAMDFFMGARMHSTIAAFSAAVPVVPMSYSRKFTGMFGGSLAYPHVLDMCTSDTEPALEYIKGCFDKRKELSSLEAGILSSVVDVRLAAMKETLREIISKIQHGRTSS